MSPKMNPKTSRIAEAALTIRTHLKGDPVVQSEVTNALVVLDGLILFAEYLDMKLLKYWCVMRRNSLEDRKNAMKNKMFREERKTDA